MGMIINGKYYKDADMNKLRTKTNSMYKQHEHDRQRKDFAREILQPFDRHGNPNEQFVEAYPEEAKEYGFIKVDEEVKRSEHGQSQTN
jgi:hypothetical protein